MRPTREIKIEEELEIVKRYTIGLEAYHKIARDFKIGTPRVKEILFRYGHKIRKSNDLNHFIWTEEKKQELLELLKTESNHSEIQSKLSFPIGKERIKEFISSNLVKRNELNLYEYWKARFGPEKAEELNIKLKQKQSANFSGEGNPMFGKPSPQVVAMVIRVGIKDFTLEV